MSITINTNTAASLAANNLAYSNKQLDASLNRLSSGSKIVNASDDAGGAAVALKLNAEANRDMMLSQNLGDAVSYAQTQDGALSVVGSILDRISELKTLASDPTKNSSDLANYDDEFTQLQSELVSIGNQTFNGVNLFGSSTLNVDTTDNLSTASAIGLAEQDLLGSPAFPTLSDNWSNLSNWTPATPGIGASVGVSGNQLNLAVNTGDAYVTSNASFTGPAQITTTLNLTSGNGGLDFYYGGVDVASFSTFSSIGNHSLTVDIDSSGNYSSYLDGSSTAFQTGSGIDTSASSDLKIDLNAAGGGTSDIGPITIASTSGGAGNTDAVATAASLSSLSLSTVTSAIQDVATMRAENGAEQSRLNFASTLLTTNQTNLQSAVSAIQDVDVASETSNLAKWNVLVQSGSAMLSQANQGAEIALKLITGQ